MTQAPLEIVAEEAAAHGRPINSGPASRAFLLGFLIGRAWNDEKLSDKERLRQWLRSYFAGVGARRRKAAPGRSEPV